MRKKLLFFLLIYAYTAIGSLSAQMMDCSKMFDKVIQMYEPYRVDEYFLNYTMWYEDKATGQKTDPVTTSFWCGKDWYRQESDAMTHLQDREYRLVVLKNRKVILLSNAPQNDDEHQYADFRDVLSLQKMGDSLQAAIADMSCRPGLLNMSIKEDYIDKVGASRIKIFYKDGQITRTETTIPNTGKPVIMVCLLQGFKPGLPHECIPEMPWRLF